MGTRRKQSTNALISETIKQIHQPWKQRLIYRKWHQYAINEVIDSYR